MSQGYDEAARSARDAGFIQRHHVDEWQVRADLRNFLNVDDPDSPGGRRLVERTIDSAMDQTVRSYEGEQMGTRRVLTTWEDAHGNIMGQNTETGKRRKLVDSEERGL